jgi:MEMO1 family protein
MMMIRHPAVAHQFYPGDPPALSRTIAGLLPEAGLQKKSAMAVIAPHAGYIYSGKVAAETFARVEIPPDLILLGPNHRGSGAKIAIMREGRWEMPLGDIPLNEELAGRIIGQDPELIVEDENAHRYEHSLEVQVPFLQYLQRELRLTPLVLSHLSYPQCVRLGSAIAAAIMGYGQPVLIVASTDMTHYESRAAATAKDQLAIKHIEELDPEGLYRTVAAHQISMCGVIPTTVALIAAIALGARRAELICYSDSGETSGDLDQVVGYAGLVID